MTSSSTFTISPEAAKKITEFAHQQGYKEATLRIEVKGGGCSGFEYHYELTDTKTKDDQYFQKDNAHVLIDEMSLTLVKDSMLDYEETLGKGGFKIVNPNATASCGCGNSFSVG